MEGSENEQHEGRTHVRPSPGDSVGYWLRILLGFAAIVTLIITATNFISAISTRLSVVETTVQAQDIRITQNTDTINRIYVLLNNIAVDVAQIKGALGVKN